MTVLRKNEWEKFPKKSHYHIANSWKKIVTSIPLSELQWDVLYTIDDAFGFERRDWLIDLFAETV